MPGYDNDAYLQSLDQSSEDIRRQVSNTLAEISRQRKVAGEQAAKIPAAAANIYGAGQNSVDSDMASISRIDRHGNQAVTPLASLMAAFDDGSASYGRAAGLLDQGFGEQAIQRSSDANSLLQQLLADQTSKANLYVGGRESEDRDREFQRGEAERRAALEREMQDRDSALQRELADLETRNQTYMPPSLIPSLIPGRPVVPPVRRPSPADRGLL